MNLQSPILIPSYLPDAVKASIAASGGTLAYDFAFSAAERKVLKKKKRVPPSIWVPKNRVITYGPFAGQLWRADLTPYLSGIMDAMAFASVQEFYLVKGVQTGGSEAVHSFAGWSIEFLKVPILYVYPAQKIAKENSQDRIRPMIEKSPVLSQYFTGDEDDRTNYRINLLHMPIYIAWASSAAELSSKPIGLAIADETEIYPDEVSEKHADPLSEMRDRLTVYLAMGMGKLIALSTPARPDGPIIKGFSAASCRFELYVTCPSCGHEQIMNFSGVVWPRIHKESGKLTWVDPKADDAEKKDYIHPEPVKIREEKLARYKCAKCETFWDDARRNEAAAKSVWRETSTGMPLMPYLKKRRPISVGMKLPSWPSWFFSLSTGAALWVEYLQTKNKLLLRRFLNKICAETYTEYRSERKEDKILDLRDERPAGLVPSGNIVSGLVAGIDTQDNGFWYWIHAFGYGPSEESWEIRSGFVDSIEAIRRIILEDVYENAEKRRYLVRWAVQDAMGHRTSEVYDFCRMGGIRGRIVPFKGEGRMAAPTAWTKVDTYPGTSKIIPGGLMLLRANVNHYKDKISGKLSIAGADPGALHLSSDFDYDKASHLCAEIINEKNGLWENPLNRPNHLWDCLMLCFVAADVIGLRFMANRRDGPACPSDTGGNMDGKSSAPIDPNKPDPATGSKWIGTKSGFVKRW